jgi:hypothetical protein
MLPVTRHRGGSSCVPEAVNAQLSVCAFDPGTISFDLANVRAAAQSTPNVVKADYQAAAL